MVWEALVGTELRASAPAAEPAEPSAAVAELLALHERHRLPAFAQRELTHAEYWSAVGPGVDRAPNPARRGVGRSREGRPLHLVRFGDGPATVLLWSQMHGDESTASMALADIFAYFAAAPSEPRVRRLAERLTVLFIPMLNPDGAERFQRRNA